MLYEVFHKRLFDQFCDCWFSYVGRNFRKRVLIENDEPNQACDANDPLTRSEGYYMHLV